MPSFTQRIPNLEEVGPVIEITLTPSIPFMQMKGINLSSNNSIKIFAMIDTESSGSVISDELATTLGINPIGITYINTPSSINVKCFQYDVQLIFPNNVNIDSIVVTEAPLQGQNIQCLIGRDVLQHGVLIYTGYDNSFTLSF